RRSGRPAQLRPLPAIPPELHLVLYGSTADAGALRPGRLPRDPRLLLGRPRELRPVRRRAGGRSDRVLAHAPGRLGTLGPHLPLPGAAPSPYHPRRRQWLIGTLGRRRPDPARPTRG